MPNGAKIILLKQNKEKPPERRQINVVVDVVERCSHTYFFGAMFVFVTSLIDTVVERVKKRKHNVKNNNNLLTVRDSLILEA